jgi:L-alanine-DL-glutamate epimerase-like enolase superfamily enzyme
MQIAGIAEASFATISPHMYCGPLADTAALQVATYSPNFSITEANQELLHKKYLRNL